MGKLICVLLLFVSNLVSAQSDLSGPQLSLNKDTHDYGVLNYKANGECQFVVTNVGSEPLKFIVRGSCTCAITFWSDEPVPPGKTSVIMIRYETGRVGEFEKTFTITSNALNEPSKVIRICGKVLPESENKVPLVEPVPKN